MGSLEVKEKKPNRAVYRSDAGTEVALEPNRWLKAKVLMLWHMYMRKHLGMNFPCNQHERVKSNKSTTSEVSALHTQKQGKEDIHVFVLKIIQKVWKSLSKV